MQQLLALAIDHNVPVCGKDFKTGQTLIKTVLAPMFKARMLGVAGWSLYQERTSQEPIDRRAMGLRGLGFALALATSCGLATLHYTGRTLPNTAAPPPS